MNKTSKILTFVLLATVSLTAMAQNGSNSSYSRFGLGTLAEASQTFNRAMGGVAYGLRNGARINMLNPASYSCTDSLSMLFDVGMSLQFGYLSSPSGSLKARNATLSNINMGFHVAKNLGMSVGFVPYSTIGYTFEESKPAGTNYATGQIIKTNTTYSGSGGLQEIYIGAGWKPFANLSIGANIGYMWGTYSHSLSQVFTEGGSTSSSYSSQHQTYNADLRTYKLDVGVQYPVQITKQDWLTIGAVYSLGHRLGGDATMLRYTSTYDSTTYVAKKPFEIPHSIGAGLSWQHKNQLWVAADVTYEKWKDCQIPTSKTSSTGVITYEGRTGSYIDRLKYAVGFEFTPNPMSRNYMQTIRYRAGFNYSTPYLKVNGQDGPSEYHATLGFGIPLSMRRLSGRSMINVSGEWMMRKPTIAGMIKENYFLINIGITFNERWFMKWKIE